MSASPSKLGLLAGLAMGVIVLDLASKAIALRHVPYDGLVLLPVLSFRVSFNSGVSFGLLAEGSAIFVTLLSGTILSVLAVFAARAQTSAERAGFALIFGGGIANLIDRIKDGAVTDFIDAHAAGWHFPTFNLADMAITLGLGFLVFGARDLFGRSMPSRPA